MTGELFSLSKWSCPIQNQSRRERNRLSWLFLLQCNWYAWCDRYDSCFTCMVRLWVDLWLAKDVCHYTLVKDQKRNVVNGSSCHGNIKRSKILLREAYEQINPLCSHILSEWIERIDELSRNIENIRKKRNWISILNNFFLQFERLWLTLY